MFVKFRSYLHPCPPCSNSGMYYDQENVKRKEIISLFQIAIPFEIRTFERIWKSCIFWSTLSISIEVLPLVLLLLKLESCDKVVCWRLLYPVDLSDNLQRSTELKSQHHITMIMCMRWHRSSFKFFQMCLFQMEWLFEIKKKFLSFLHFPGLSTHQNSIKFHLVWFWEGHKKFKMIMCMRWRCS